MMVVVWHNSLVKTVLAVYTVRYLKTYFIYHQTDRKLSPNFAVTVLTVVLKWTTDMGLDWTDIPGRDSNSHLSKLFLVHFIYLNIFSSLF
jgi:hypothetical protein